METYALTYPSSHEYWNKIFRLDSLSPSRMNLPLLLQPALQASELAYLTPEQMNAFLSGAGASLSRAAFADNVSASVVMPQLKTPLHLLVGTQAQKRKVKDVVCHVCSQPLPPASFVFTGGPRVYGAASRVVVASPEFTFLQAASKLSFEDLLMLGYSYCGFYFLDKLDSRGFVNRAPITTPERLTKFLAKAKGLHGRTAALRVAPYVLARSASPMESVVATLLSLPRKLGGYGLAQPMLNYRIDIPSKWRGAFDSDYIVVDACWHREKVALGFNGKEWHTGRENMALDTDRINLLQAMGYTVIPLMYEQVVNTGKFDAAVRTLCRALKVRYRALTAEQEFLHEELKRSLLL